MQPRSLLETLLGEPSGVWCSATRAISHFGPHSVVARGWDLWLCRVPPTAKRTQMQCRSASCGCACTHFAGLAPRCIRAAFPSGRTVSEIVSRSFLRGLAHRGWAACTHSLELNLDLGPKSIRRLCLLVLAHSHMLQTAWVRCGSLLALVGCKAGFPALRPVCARAKLIAIQSPVDLNSFRPNADDGRFTPGTHSSCSLICAPPRLSWFVKPFHIEKKKRGMDSDANLVEENVWICVSVFVSLSLSFFWPSVVVHHQ